MVCYDNEDALAENMPLNVSIDRRVNIRLSAREIFRMNNIHLDVNWMRTSNNGIVAKASADAFK
jgi:hypothetical protein